MGILNQPVKLWSVARSNNEAGSVDEDADTLDDELELDPIHDKISVLLDVEKQYVYLQILEDNKIFSKTMTLHETRIIVELLTKAIEALSN